MKKVFNAEDNHLKKWPVSDFYILDVEYTACKNSLENNWNKDNEWREIIEIGAILISHRNNQYKIVSELNLSVKPTLNPILSQYIIDLTGITQERIDLHGIKFKSAAHQLNQFFINSIPIIFNGNDGQIFRENYAINDLQVDFWLKNGFNFRPLLSSNLKISYKDLISSDLPKIANIEDLHAHHSAIGDCRSIFNALNFWHENGDLN